MSRNDAMGNRGSIQAMNGGGKPLPEGPADARGRHPAAAARLATLLAGAAILLAALAAYQNTFFVPFIFDDAPAITENPTILHLWPIRSALSPPRNGSPVAGRPLINLSLALNYAVGGTASAGYHGFNLAIHALAGLILFGLVRRTLLQPVLRARFGAAALPLALSAALIWIAHPLQTGAVTYVSQRAESIMGLLYLLTLYCFLRGTQSSAPRLWYVLTAAACLAGMASKEVMVSAPLMVLLYDRTFVAGSFRQAWRQRRALYVGLSATWVLLAWLVAGAHNRGGTAGFGTAIPWWMYALTQARAVVHYLSLAVWPHPLVFDYGGGVLVQRITQIVPQMLILSLLATGTVISLWRWPIFGFLGCWVFAILAPSSSVVPVATELMAEHRMYLPLAALVTLAVLGTYAVVGRWSLALFPGLALLLVFLTARRNDDYRSALVIWSDTVAKRPDNARAQNNLGLALLDLGKVDEAIACYRRASELQPDYVTALNDLGIALAKKGEMEEAMRNFRRALEILPEDPVSQNNIGLALAQQGQLDEAADHFQKALELRPNYANAHVNLGDLLFRRGRVDEAIAHYQKATETQTSSVESHVNYGSALRQVGRTDEAIAQYRIALRINPNFPAAYYNLGNALVRQGRMEEAIASWQKALELQPGYAEAHNNLANVLLERGKANEAIAHLQKAMEARPDLVPARDKLAWVLATSPDPSLRNGPRAVELAQETDRLAGGNNPAMLMTLGAAYAEAGRFPEALATTRRALELATAQTNSALTNALQKQRQLYQAGLPFRDNGQGG